MLRIENSYELQDLLSFGGKKAVSNKSSPLKCRAGALLKGYSSHGYQKVLRSKYQAIV